jgi:hypothetical protein
MPPVYRGQPKRNRKKASVPRAHRHKTASANEENKENMHSGAEKLFERMNAEIDSLANETGYARSTVARAAFGNKKYSNARKPNYKNAWIYCRMPEVNKGE